MDLQWTSVACFIRPSLPIERPHIWNSTAPVCNASFVLKIWSLQKIHYNPDYMWGVIFSGFRRLLQNQRRLYTTVFAVCNSSVWPFLLPPPSFTPFYLLLQAVRLESAYPQVTRYMVVVSTNGRQDTEESIVLGMDFVSSDRSVPRQQYTTLSFSVTLALIKSHTHDSSLEEMACYPVSSFAVMLILLFVTACNCNILRFHNGDVSSNWNESFSKWRLK